MWDLIGGHAKPEETPEEALLREVEEETGAIPTEFSLLTIAPEPDPAAHGPCEYHVFLVRGWAGSEPFLRNAEHVELRWFTPSEACKLDLADPVYLEWFARIEALQSGAARNVNERLLRTRCTYDKIARRFLENTRDRSMLSFWLERFAELVGSGATVLDLGAGPGCDSAELRRLGLRPISLDLSLGMLRAGVLEFAGPRVQGDARQLPFRDGSLGGIWASASLLHLSPDEAAAAVREARRVLGVAGLLHVSVKAGDGAGWESERYGEPRWFQYWSGADLDALLTTEGFSVIASWANSTPRDDWLVRHCVPAERGPTVR